MLLSRACRGENARGGASRWRREGRRNSSADKKSFFIAAPCYHISFRSTARQRLSSSADIPHVEELVSCIITILLSILS